MVHGLPLERRRPEAANRPAARRRQAAGRVRLISRGGRQAPTERSRRRRTAAAAAAYPRSVRESFGPRAAASPLALAPEHERDEESPIAEEHAPGAAPGSPTPSDRQEEQARSRPDARRLNAADQEERGARTTARATREDSRRRNLGRLDRDEVFPRAVAGGTSAGALPVPDDEAPRPANPQGPSALPKSGASTGATARRKPPTLRVHRRSTGDRSG